MLKIAMSWFPYIRSTHSSAFNVRSLYGSNRMVMSVAMVKVAPGQHRSIYCSLKGKEGISDIYPVSGEYDFFMIVQAESFAKLNRLMEDIQDSQHAIKARVIGRLR